MEITNAALFSPAWERWTRLVQAQRFRRHVLVIDDEPSIGEVLREVFQDEGCRVTSRGAPPMVEEIAKLAPDVIVLDLVFGGSNDGVLLLAALRAHPATAAIPLIVCSAAWEQVRQLAAKPADGVIVVPKPFDLDEIVAVVTAAGSRAERTRL